MKKHLVLKVIVTLLPAIIFAQNYGWMTLYKGFGYVFVALWIFNILLVLNAGKNRTLSEVFRVSEIGAFLLPISALVMTFVIGGKAVGELGGQEAAQAGAAIGTAIGGMFAVGIAFVFGLFGGIILHLLANRFEKKADAEVNEGTAVMPGNFFEKHKIVTTIVFVIILIVVSNLVSGEKAGDEKQTQNSPQEESVVATDDTQNQEETPTEMPKETTPAPVEISKVIVKDDGFGNPTVSLNLKNISEKEIDGVKIEIKTFNNFDEPAKGFLSDNTFRGVSQDKIVAGGSKTVSWTLYNYEGVTKAQPTITSIHFVDGSGWGE